MSIFTTFCFAGDKADFPADKSYGDALVAKIIAVDDDFVFRCDIKDWPAVIGKDIAVRVNAVGAAFVGNKTEKPDQPSIDPKKFIE